MGSNSAWLPSRRSVLHHTGSLSSRRVGHFRSGRSTVGYGRYFFDGSLSMAINSGFLETGTRLFRVHVRLVGFPSCQRRRVARVWLRLGRKKQERTKQRRGAAKGLARLFVA
jgi:hypothetical protein